MVTVYSVITFCPSVHISDSAKAAFVVDLRFSKSCHGALTFKNMSSNTFLLGDGKPTRVPVDLLGEYIS